MRLPMTHQSFWKQLKIKRPRQRQIEYTHRQCTLEHPEDRFKPTALKLYGDPLNPNKLYIDVTPSRGTSANRNGDPCLVPDVTNPAQLFLETIMKVTKGFVVLIVYAAIYGSFWWATDTYRTVKAIEKQDRQDTEQEYREKNSETIEMLRKMEAAEREVERHAPSPCVR
jgi:hypothetical protein